MTLFVGKTDKISSAGASCLPNFKCRTYCESANVTRSGMDDAMMDGWMPSGRRETNEPSHLVCWLPQLANFDFTTHLPAASAGVRAN